MKYARLIVIQSILYKIMGERPEFCVNGQMQCK